jgi:hypothetical protein
MTDRHELMSMVACAALLAWVRFATGQGAINIILDSLPSLGID